MATLAKTVELNVNLNPADVLAALVSFTQQDWHRLQSEIKRLQREQNINVAHWFNFPSPDEIANLSDLSQWSLIGNDGTAPPLTPEGDREALAAAEELFTLFDNIDPELARWGATSEEISLLDSYF